MKRMIAITIAAALAVSLTACNTTNPSHTTTEVIAGPVTIDAQDTLPFATAPTTEPPTTEAPTELPRETTPPVTEKPAQTETQHTQPKPTEPIPTTPVPTESTPTEPPATKPPVSEEGTCSPWCVLGEFSTILEPTTTSTGLEVAYCKNCGKEFTNEMPRLISPEKLENVDPRITISKNLAHATVNYKYKHLAVTDIRSWGAAPIMVITEDDCLDITYYKQDGTMVSYTLHPFEGYVNSFVIFDDGSFATQLWGDYSD